MSLALAAAKSSQHKTRVGAVVVKSGRVLAIKPNRFKNNPLNAPPTRCSVHAEVAALRSCGTNARGSTVYVARVGGYELQQLAKPCPRCSAYIVKAGLKRAVWTTAEGMDQSRARELV